jgi:hypothetical protein
MIRSIRFTAMACLAMLALPLLSRAADVGTVPTSAPKFVHFDAVAQNPADAADTAWVYGDVGKYKGKAGTTPFLIMSNAATYDSLKVTSSSFALTGESKPQVTVTLAGASGGKPIAAVVSTTDTTLSLVIRQSGTIIYNVHEQSLKSGTLIRYGYL